MKKLALLLGLLVLSSGISFAQYSTTPIMLSLPMDADTIEEDEPLLVWQTTLSNLENDPRLNVRLSVVQLGEDQTPTEAILENSPVFMRQNLLSNSINYSAIDHELVEGTWYAWQVVLLYNGVQVQQSEVFTFIKAGTTSPKQSFYTLKTKADNTIIPLTDNVIYFTTTEKGEFQLKAAISGKKIVSQTIRLEEINMDEGSNNTSHPGREARYFKCDLSELNLKKGTYRIDWEANTDHHFVTLIQKK